MTFRCPEFCVSLRSVFLFTTALLALNGCEPKQAEEAPQSSPRGKLVMTHFMHQMSIGAECKPEEGTLAFAPTLPNDTVAEHVPETLPIYPMASTPPITLRGAACVASMRERPIKYQRVNWFRFQIASQVRPTSLRRMWIAFLSGAIPEASTWCLPMAMRNASLCL